MENKKINIIGAGLAGVETAMFLADRNIYVNLYDMKPSKKTEAQTSENFAELVCSNSFRGLTNAVGELKNELHLLKSNIMDVAFKTKVPAGNALAVDRELFSKMLTEKIKNHPFITVIEKEVESLNLDEINIITTGPLTSEKFSKYLQSLLDEKNFYFYDAIAPIIDASSINYEKVFKASRWNKGESEEGDYLNCPMNKEEYENFLKLLREGEKVEFHDFEKAKYFSGCLPIEVMAERGDDDLRYGPMKPVGLKNPKEPGVRYYAVVQLRTENNDETFYNMVGFQTKLKYSEQKKVFSAIPGLENAEFLRYGSIHRNTFINAPKLMNKDLSLKNYPNIYISGQLSGVEGYVESFAMGLLTAISVYERLNGREFTPPNNFTALGALYEHLILGNKDNFQPSNINFSLFGKMHLQKLKKQARDEKRSEFAFETLQKWLSEQKF